MSKPHLNKVQVKEVNFRPVDDKILLMASKVEDTTTKGVVLPEKERDRRKYDVEKRTFVVVSFAERAKTIIPELEVGIRVYLDRSMTLEELKSKSISFSEEDEGVYFIVQPYHILGAVVYIDGEVPVKSSK